MDARTQHLLARALDGELTPIEQQEWERKRRGSRAVAAEARSWGRVESELRASLDQAPALALERIAGRVAQRAARQRSRRPLVAAASLVLLGALALVQGAESGALVAPPIAERPVVAERWSAPVEVHVEPSLESPALVRIEF
jgi:ferric-dicitrate binding protein FerR (iron transport regulator)